MSDSKADGNHPSISVLLEYVTGSLGFAHRCVVATHLPMCSACRDTVSFLKEVEHHVLACIRPVEAPSDLLDRCLASIERDNPSPSERENTRIQQETRYEVDGTVLPPSLAGLKPSRLRWLAPGIRHCMLWHDEYSTLHFVQVKPGVSLPAHRHRGLELTCVLSGAYHDGDGRLFSAGDISEEDDADEDHPRSEHDHHVKAELSGDCVCVMATTGRLLFSGWIARLLQPMMPF